MQPYAISVRFEGAASTPSVATASDGEGDEAAAAAVPATAADGVTELVLFPALSQLGKRKVVHFVRNAAFSFDVVYTVAADGHGHVADGPAHLATVHVDGFDDDKVADHLSRANKPPRVRAAGPWGPLSGAGCAR